MTINTTLSRVDSLGNGVTTAFPVSFIFFGLDELQVIERDTATGAETVLVRGTHYSVSGGLGATGTVTATVAPATGKQWTIRRNTAPLQETDFNRNDPLPSDSVERALDRAMAVVQETLALFERAVRVPASDPLPATLPPVPVRANKLLGCDANGNVIAAPGASIGDVVVSAFAATLLDDADAAAARTTLGAGAAGSAIFTAADAAAARSTLGGTATGSAIFTAADAAAARTTLGATTVGAALLTAVDAAAARLAAGAAGRAGDTFTGLVGFGDVNHYLHLAAGAALHAWDANDFMGYNRASNLLQIVIGGIERLSLGSAGVLNLSARPTVAGAPIGINLSVAQASTSGTEIDFVGIPAGVRRVVVLFSGVSTNGTAAVRVRLGNGSFVTSGYASGGGNTGASGSTATAGFDIHGFTAAADVRHGEMELIRLTGNAWVASGGFGVSNNGVGAVMGGSITLGGELDRIRVTTSNGTDAFDAGTLNVSWEF